MYKKILFIACFIVSTLVNAQDYEFIPLEVAVDKNTTGTLLAPDLNRPVPLVIFIQDSGNINRDGNQPYGKNDAFKLLAEELSKHNIASYRYDKRVLQMRKLNIKEEDMRFNDFVKDASAIVDFFKPQERFNKIIIIGHGEGSLIGMIAAQNGVDGFISLGGAGEPIHELVLAQIEQQIPGLKENAKNAFDEMLQYGHTNNYNSALENIFKPTVQPYMLSWMQYDPAEEIKKLEVPVLIINGTKDLQVPISQAEILKGANPKAELVTIKNMNHILKIIEGDDIENAKSFNEPLRPVSEQLVKEIVDFVKNKV